jgi:transcriptional regulator with XRE-family HTH domain
MANSFDKQLGENIKTLRKSYGLSQKAAGTALGYTQSQICKIENGKCTITAEHIIQFSRLFEIPVHLFFSGTEALRTQTLDELKLAQLNDRDYRLIYGLIDQMLSEPLAK